MRLRVGQRLDVAVDLGTANTVVCVRGEGVVVFEPSVIAVSSDSGEVLAVGEAAKQMIGRTPSAIRAERPLRHGVIADFDVTEQMLAHFLRRVGVSRTHRPRVILCIPSGVTGVEREAVEEVTLKAGARKAYLIEEPMAAAIGAGLPVTEPRASMVVDIGGGTTEVAVISLEGMVVSRSLRVGGYDLDEAIIRYTRVHKNLSIGQQTAEQAKIALGAALPADAEDEFEVRGREGHSGMIKAATLTTSDVHRALSHPLAQIVTVAVHALEATPPELAADLAQDGITLAGGGALLTSLDARLRAETNVPVQIADSPLTCVAIGAEHRLEHLNQHEPVTRTRRSARTRIRDRQRGSAG
ncbi:MAG: rod shape-determining protein [Gaiellales bacterium]